MKRPEFLTGRLAAMLSLGGVMAVAAGMAHAQAPQSQLDPLQVRSLAASCAGCHGTNGVAQGAMASLAGANKDDMLRKLMDYKAGKLPATVMHQLSKGYSDEQLAALAVYFSVQKK